MNLMIRVAVLTTAVFMTATWAEPIREDLRLPPAVKGSALTRNVRPDGSEVVFDRIEFTSLPTHVRSFNFESQGSLGFVLRDVTDDTLERSLLYNAPKGRGQVGPSRLALLGDSRAELFVTPLSALRSLKTLHAAGAAVERRIEPDGSVVYTVDRPQRQGPLAVTIDPLAGTVRRVLLGPDENCLRIEFEEYREVGPGLVHPFRAVVDGRHRGGAFEPMQRIEVTALSPLSPDATLDRLVLPENAVLFDQQRGAMVDAALQPLPGLAAGPSGARPPRAAGSLQAWVLAGAGILFVAAAVVYTLRRRSAHRGRRP